MIRISAAGLCRITIAGRFLLGLNKARLSGGRHVLAPIGGAAQFLDEARPFLVDELGAVLESENELRLHLDERAVPGFERWFRSRRDRELTPLRELREELLHEYRVDMPWRDPAIRLVVTRNEHAVTDRPGAEGKRTIRYLEIFDVGFDEASVRALHAACNGRRSDLALVTAEEIAAGMHAGTEIATTAKFILP
jgi:hypothetical protein